MDKNEINKITEIIIECAIKVHEKLGPGLFESVYEKTIVYELRKKGLKVDEQAAISIKYEDIIFKEGFRGDLIVNDEVIVELKSIKEFEKIHYKTLLTYLRMANKKVGLLINFNKELIKHGLKRIINGNIK